MALMGKGFYLWKIRTCENGDVHRIAQVAAEANLSHVMVKVADGNYIYNIDPNTKVDLVPPLVAALKAKNIQVWGWHYVYGIDPNAEADRAIQRVKQLNLDGYIIDAEVEYRDTEKQPAAYKFMRRLRSGLPNTPIALSSYRYPSLHPSLPWKEFLQFCDINMPQVYWLNSHNPVDQLKRSVTEFQKITPYRPVIPTGPIFRYGTWTPSPLETTEFMQAAQNLNLTAVNFWEWSKARAYYPELWNLIKDYPWPYSLPINDITQKYINALNNHDLNQVLSLYNADAVHVAATHAFQGQVALRKWYEQLFNQMLVNGIYSLVSYSGSGSVRHMTWTANSATGNVYNGSDTLGMYEGKISYHYSEFNISKN